MDKKDFESLLKKNPDCVSDGKKLKAFLKDLFPDVPKAIVNTLTIMADDGIISKMQMSAESSTLVAARLQKKLEDDYGLSQKIIAECFSLIIYDSAKQPQTTNNARSHEKINASAVAPSKSASKKEKFSKNTTKSGKKPLSQSIPAKGKTTKQTNTNFAGDPKVFEIENGTLKKYKGSSSVVVIPNNVTRIGEFAFFTCSGLTNITIPNSVTSIGHSAFRGCTGLTSVIIGNGVTSISDFAFFNCTGLVSVTIGNSVTRIGKFAFYNCNKLQNIYITDIAAWCNISGLDNLMYYGSSNKKLYINNELATSITIPDGVTAIPSYAFRNCSCLTSITIPASVTIIGNSAFSGCNKLQDIYITDIAAWCNISGLDNLMYYGSSNKNLYINNELATSITIPDGVTAIPSFAFKGCKGFTSITIPDSVTRIGNYAFKYCSNLQDIYITDIGAWCNISGLGNLMGYGSSNKKLYINNELVTSITIPDGVTNIGGSAFKGCSGLTSITIPGSVTSIGAEAFSGCRNLTIYCEAESKPIGWSSSFNPEHRPVVWGVKK